MRLSLDTNILVRLVLNDHPRLSPAAAELVRQQDCHVSIIALAEMGFVLLSVYEATMAEVVACARKLVAVAGIEVEAEARVVQALDGVEAGMDWFDAMLWAAAPTDTVLATFDKRFAKRAERLQWQPPVELHLPSAR